MCGTMQQQQQMLLATIVSLETIQGASVSETSAVAAAPAPSIPACAAQCHQLVVLVRACLIGLLRLIQLVLC